MNGISSTSSSAPYWGLLKDLSNKDKLTLISMLSNSLVNEEREKEEENDDTDWASRFCGVWKDNRSAEEIVDEIRSMRTANSFDLEL
jgi:hypothetical protein